MHDVPDNPDPLSHYQLLVSLIPEQLSRLGWSRERIDAEQKLALRAMVAHAKAHSPWHRARLRHLDPDALELEDLEHIPAMTKADLMENWDGIVTDPKLRLADVQAYLRERAEEPYFGDGHVVLTSGGTSGQTAIVVYDWHAFAVNRAAMTRSMMPLMLRIGPPGKLPTATVSANTPGHVSYRMGTCFAPPQGLARRFPMSLPLDEIVAGLNETQPVMLHCLSSYLSILCDEAREGRLNIKPALVFATSEPLSETDAAQARALWDSTVLTSWSATECAGSCPCPAGTGFHVLEDINIIEPRMANDTPAPTGTVSDYVLISNLYNKVLPLLRYRMDDRFELTDGPCGCGSQYRTVARVHGRNYEMFKYGRYRTAVHPEVLEAPVLKLPNIVEYQLRQTEAGVDIQIVSHTEIDVADVIEETEALLQTTGIPEPVVTVVQVENITRTANGKLIRYAPLQNSVPG